MNWLSDGSDLFKVKSLRGSALECMRRKEISVN
jgi:hypothetical protein